MSEPILELSFGAGLDEATRDELMEPGRGWPVLGNIRQDRRGAASKRLGFKPLPQLVVDDLPFNTRFGGTTRQHGNRLLCHNEVVCTIDGTYLDAYAETQDASAVANRVPEASCTARQLSTISSGLLGVVLCRGYIATAAIRNGDIIASVETESGVVVRAPEVIFAGNTAGLVSYSTYIILIAHLSSSANIKAWYLNTATPSTVSTGWTSLGNLAIDKTTTGLGALELSVQSLSNRVAFAYVNDSGGTSQLTVRTSTISSVLETVTVNTSSTKPQVIAIEGSIADTLWVAWNESTTIKVKGLDADSLLSTLATTGSIGTTVSAPGPGDLYLVSTTTGSGRLGMIDGDGVNFRFKNFTTTAGACVSSGLQSSVYGTLPAARPIYFSGRLYGLFETSSLSGVLVLCDWTDTITDATRWLRPIAMGFPYLSGGGLRDGGSPLVFSSTSFGYATTVQRSSTGDAVTLLTYDFVDRKRWRSVVHNGSLYFAGGILSYFDGRRVSEASFLHAPKVVTATDSGGGSGPNGAYRYVATYEEMDDDGNWCLSAVSPAMPSSVTVTDNAITASTTPLVMTGRLLPGVSGASSPDIKRLRTSFWRTLAGGEPPYYFVDSVENDTGDAAEITDSTTDTTLRSHRLLYGTGNLPGTNGSGQDRRAPPFCADLESYNGMLVVASGSSLYWSGQTVDGEGVWFSPAFYQAVEGPGDITAIRAQDGTLYVWKRRSVWAVAGEAPSDNGSTGGLGTPRKLAADVGCIDPNSVVVTSTGIFFQSERGIEIMNRGGGIAWIGEAIQSTLESFPIVTSAVLDDRNGLVRFTLAEDESGGRASGDGRTVVFDLTLTQWVSVDDVTGNLAHEPAQDAAVITVNGERRYGWLSTDGTVYYERDSSDASAHLDGGSEAWVTQSAVSPWIAIAGRNGEQFIDQVLLLAKRVTGHDVTISIAFDYSSSYTSTKTLTAAQVASLAREWLVKEITQTTSQAVRVKIEDATPSSGSVGTGKGADWVALTFNGQPHRGPKRSSSAQRGGS